jgi:hypothetical protein
MRNTLKHTYMHCAEYIYSSKAHVLTLSPLTLVMAASIHVPCCCECTVHIVLGAACLVARCPCIQVCLAANHLHWWLTKLVAGSSINATDCCLPVFVALRRCRVGLTPA